MTDHPRTLETLAALFAYPQQDYYEHMREAASMNASDDAFSAFIASFVDEMNGKNISELEELYTRTFDINPVASLEIGWHLYGEQYERGAFLVQMRSRLRALGVEEGTELPDHLHATLRMLARADQEERAQFITNYLRAALQKIYGGLECKENPYRFLVAAAAAATDVTLEQTEGVAHHV